MGDSKTVTIANYETIFKEGGFRSLTFTIGQVANCLKISKTTLISLEEKEIIKSKIVQRGKVPMRLLNWNEIANVVGYLNGRITKSHSKIKVFANIKGGVGKSTISTQYAIRASSCGQKTLFIDADPQGHGSRALGINGEVNYWTIGDVIDGDCSIQDAVIKSTPLLDIISANLNLSTVDRVLDRLPNRDRKIGKLLNPIKDQYDLIIVDTNPASSILNNNFYLAADELVVVVQTEPLAVAGLGTFLSIVTDLQEGYPDYNPGIRIIPNLYIHGESICRKSLAFLEQHYGRCLTKNTIRKNTDIKEAQDKNLGVWHLNKRSYGAIDLINLTDELNLKHGEYQVSNDKNEDI